MLALDSLETPTRCFRRLQQERPHRPRGRLAGSASRQYSYQTIRRPEPSLTRSSELGSQRSRLCHFVLYITRETTARQPGRTGCRAAPTRSQCLTRNVLASGQRSTGARETPGTPPVQAAAPHHDGPDTAPSDAHSPPRDSATAKHGSPRSGTPHATNSTHHGNAGSSETPRPASQHRNAYTASRSVSQEYSSRAAGGVPRLHFVTLRAVSLRWAGADDASA
jgi:hypothetical protein